MNDDLHVSKEARKTLIEDFEGLILQAYDDANDRVVKAGQYVHGTLTIGYGHTDAAGPPKVYIGQVITKEQADQILSDDLKAVENEVKKLVKVRLNSYQFDALTSFQFNTGWLGHKHCSLIEALNAGKYDLADKDFMLYDRAQGKVLKGLSRRRQAEKDWFHRPVLGQN